MRASEAKSPEGDGPARRADGDENGIPDASQPPASIPDIATPVMDSAIGQFTAGRYVRDAPILAPGQQPSTSTSPFHLSMPFVSPGQLAFSAMQYLPVPVLLLNSLKTVVMANEAMGRMLGMGAASDGGGTEDLSGVQDNLRGQSLSQVGVDMLQGGRPVWISWEAFLDSMVHEMGTRVAVPKPQSQGNGQDHGLSSGLGLLHGDAPDATPKLCPAEPSSPPVEDDGPRQTPQDAVVEVIISRKGLGKSSYNAEMSRKKDSEHQIYAKMIITVWEIEDQHTYFTLTFTSPQSKVISNPSTRKSIARPEVLDAADRKSIVTSAPPSAATSRDSNSSNFRISPSAVSLSSTPFPPMGPPFSSAHASAPSVLQKLIVMKDALLDTTQMPILAMWKDGSATFPNKAARNLFRRDEALNDSLDGLDLLRNWKVHNEDFTRVLEVDEYPMSVLLKTESPFSGFRIGMFGDNGEKKVFDCLGEAILNDETGEFMAGVITCRDVTIFKQEISDIKEKDEERFKLICDTMPQLVWTTTADGMHDFFNTRWYHYTGLTPDESLGLGWKSPFHPDDMPSTVRRWTHSLKTGEPYVTEYRCRSKEGEWKWFLGRALPLRNKQTGEIEKWFGTCTDVHEPMEATLAAKRTREQLLSVIAHARVTLFNVDTSRKVTMLEGSLIWDSVGHDGAEKQVVDSHWFIGASMYDVFNRLTPDLPVGERPVFLKPIEDILNGKKADGIQEHGIDGRWYRTRFVPQFAKSPSLSSSKSESRVENRVDGVIGVIMDVTELKEREAALEEEAREKRQAMANEAAAKEANRLKSQFLANMSHEIRTPISGVLGMAEILGAELVEPEQREYIQNIQRSAMSLLTVINDILDFSKVESGRLDIEDIRFSLSDLVTDWSKWLRVEASLKGLDFEMDFMGDLQGDLTVIGDPGRVRQILNNLATNSLKFTKHGGIKFKAEKESETDDSIQIRFTVEDTGIGIKKEIQKRLFKPFSQGDPSTARRFGGTGLGLTICKNLLELMHGRILLQPAPGGEGTAAIFWVPFTKPKGPHSGLVAVDALPDRLQCEMSLSCNSSEFEQGVGTPPLGDGQLDKGKSPRRQKSGSTQSVGDEELPKEERAKILVLVVEDNPVNQKIATKFVTMYGFRVAALWNGKEALEYLNAAMEGKKAKPDIILMDVQMPVIDGYRCTHALRRHAPFKTFVGDVPIVAMTASAIQGDREKCMRAGMDDYLPKPVRAVTLEKMLIRWCLSKRQPNSPPSNPASASECSEASEYCGGMDLNCLTNLNLDERGDDSSPDGQRHNDPITPRPLTTNGSLAEEMSPWSSAAALEGYRSTHERGGQVEPREGGPGSQLLSRAGTDALTEENVGKLEKQGN